MRPLRLPGWIAALLLTTALARPCAAQGPAQGALWLNYGGDHSLGGRWTFTLDAQLRVAASLDTIRQYELTPGVGFAVTPALRVSAGYGYMSTHATDADGSFRAPEHRAWEAVQLAQTAGRVSLVHRLRLEQRDVRSGRSADAWGVRHRLRYQLRATAPLGPAGARAHAFYLTAADEVFAGFGGLAGRFAPDQNRASLSLGIRASPSARFEIGYLNQTAGGRGRPFAVNTHALQVSVLSSVRFRR